MAKKAHSDQELKELLTGLPFHKVKMLIDHYSSYTGNNFKKEINTIITNSLQDKLEELGINKACHECGSLHVVKKGKRPDGVQRYICRDCSKSFTLFSGTILEKTNWHWDAWVKTLQMTINHLPLDTMLTILTHDYGCLGINRKTIWLWRLKLIHALSAFDMPVLTGVIQVDETFIRESQKGSRTLESYLNKPNVRKPRFGVQPSKFGTTGPEWVTVVTAIDDRGYCVCKVAALGRLTEDVFLDLFEKHMNNPAYICSDANHVYENYCKLFEIPHYIKPSSYDKVIKKSGWLEPDETNPAKAAITKADNDKILENLFNNGLIDYISNRGDLRYADFIKIKKSAALNLGRVNELHKDIKLLICKKMTNVSTKYLQDYIGFFTYIRNWRVDNGRYPTSQKDAEQILIEILKKKVNYTITDAENQKLEFPRPSPRYVALLAEHTEKARTASGNQYFKFNEEDGLKSFNKREFLLDQPKSKLHAICKECKLTKYRNYTLYPLVSLILKQPNIYEIIYKLISTNQTIKVAQEDLDSIEAERFRH